MHTEKGEICGPPAAISPKQNSTILALNVEVTLKHLGLTSEETSFSTCCLSSGTQALIIFQNRTISQRSRQLVNFINSCYLKIATHMKDKNKIKKYVANLVVDFSVCNINTAS